jgi:hypothetical protein
MVLSRGGSRRCAGGGISRLGLPHVRMRRCRNRMDARGYQPRTPQAPLEKPLNPTARTQLDPMMMMMMMLQNRREAGATIEAVRKWGSACSRSAKNGVPPTRWACSVSGGSAKRPLGTRFPTSSPLSAQASWGTPCRGASCRRYSPRRQARNQTDPYHGPAVRGRPKGTRALGATAPTVQTSCSLTYTLESHSRNGRRRIVVYS